MKSMSVAMPVGYKPPASEMQPYMMHVMKLSNITFDDLNKRMHQDLTAKNGWNFEPWPPAGFGKILSSSSTGDFEIIIAYQGKPGSSPYGSLFAGIGMPGVPTPDHVISATPDFLNSTNPLTAMKAPSTFMVMEQKKLKPWEVTWLKMKNLGKSPFATDKDFTNLADF